MGTKNRVSEKIGVCWKIVCILVILLYSTFVSAGFFGPNAEDFQENLQRNPSQAINLIASNPDLLDEPSVMQSFERSIQNDISLLNNNPKAKEVWLDKRFQIKMIDNWVEISKFNGGELTTKGVGGVSFTAEDFKGATILKDGSLFLPKNKDAGTPNIILSNGFFRKSATRGIIVSEGSLSLGGKIFTGSFSITVNSKGTEVISYDEITYQRGNVKFLVKGTLLIPENARKNEIILIGPTLLKRNDGTTISIGANEHNHVYYSEEKTNPDKFCSMYATCIINVPGLKKTGPRARFAIKNLQGEHIDIKAPAYYDHIEILDIKQGEITFHSYQGIHTSQSSKVIVSADGTGEISIKGNNFANMNAGRFDVMHNKDPNCKGSTCTKILYHTSSNRFYNGPVGEYFSGKNRNRFVKCTVGDDCEQKLAESFGKVIRPKGDKGITTTVIVAGDNAETAKSFAHSQHCKINGCYILNSRDIPLNTKSTSLLLTGHHWSDSLDDTKGDNIWRDLRGQKYGEHHPIDRVYFSSSPSGSLFSVLPEGNVNHVEFSACNTGNKRVGEALTFLIRKYPGLESMKGWQGKAPGVDTLNTLNTKENIDEFKKKSWYKGSSSVDANLAGHQSLYLKDTNSPKRNEWFYTDNGKNCYKIKGMWEGIEEYSTSCKIITSS